jgi:PAS domain S-box-containing protein
MTRVVGSASPMLRSAAPAAAFAILYFLVAKVTGSLIGGPGIAVMWPASGVYLGVMLLASRDVWPVLACAAGIGSLAAYVHGGTSLELSVAFAVPSSAAGLLGAVLVERLTGKRFTLAGLRDVVALVGGAVVANALVALSAAAVAAQAFNVSFAESWLRWWSADVLGVIAVAPILTAHVRRERRETRARELRDAALAVAGVGVAISLALSAEPADTAALAGGAIAFPVLLWAGWRWGPRAAALGGLGVALAATHVASETYAVQSFLAVLLLGSLTFAAAMADRELLRVELRDLDTELDQGRRRIAQLTAELAARGAEVHEAGHRRDRLADDLRHEQAAKGGTERELEAAKRELSTFRRTSERLERELALAVDDRNRARHEVDETARTVGGLRLKLDDAGDELSRAKAESRALQEKLEIARAGEGRTREQLTEAVSGRRRAEQELERGSRRLEALQGDLAQAGREKAQGEQELHDARRRFADQREHLQRSLDEANRNVARAEAERRRLGDPETEMTSRYDERGICLHASPAFARLLGYEPGELLGRRGAELLHPDDRPRLARARATGAQSTFTGRLQRKAGEYVWVEVSLDPVLAWQDARVVELKATIRDVSATRSLEEPIATWRDAYAAS